MVPSATFITFAAAAAAAASFSAVMLLLLRSAGRHLNQRLFTCRRPTKP